MKLSNKETKNNIQALQFRILFFYIAIIFIALVCVTTVVLNRAGSLLTNKVSSLVAANARQIELNIDHYMQNVEATATLLFSDEAYYKYDPSTTKFDDYQQIKAEEEIADRIVDLGLMQNYTDFAVVYSSGKWVGWTSNTTGDVFSKEDLYKELAKNITNTRTEDGWVFGIGGIKDRIYYIKRLNPNAILMTSFYSRELSNVFQYPEELTGMTISLVDENDIILFSSENQLIASTLSEDVLAILNGQSSSETIANANSCKNGWRVVCQIPTSVILKEVDSMKVNVILFSILFGIVLILGGLLLIRGLLKPVDQAVESLKVEAETDELSGLYNKSGFRNVATQQLSGCDLDRIQTFVMIDMDNFKKINDSLGHKVGDEVISRMGALLKEQFVSKYTCGRLGGDEFALFRITEMQNMDALKAEISEDLEQLYKAFDTEFEKERKTLPISLSIGIALMVNERRFSNLYSYADQALYVSKESGKNQFTFYDEGK